MKKLRTAALCAVLALLAAGCSKQQPALAVQPAAANMPLVTGLPPAPVNGAPTPLLDRPPFGLYATYPSRDTLQTLSTAPLSPDGRYRANFTDQGLWVVRVDGAWLWQVPMVDPTATAAMPDPKAGQPAAAGADPNQPGAPATPAAKPATPTTKATRYLGPLNWTPKGTLLLRDDAGTWSVIDPEGAKVTPLPAALQGKDWLNFSPDGKQVLYNLPGKTGPQLWLAAADGSNAKFQGENVTGSWDPAGKLVVQKVQPPAPPGPAARPGTAEGDRAYGDHPQ